MKKKVRQSYGLKKQSSGHYLRIFSCNSSITSYSQFSQDFSSRFSKAVWCSVFLAFGGLGDAWSLPLPHTRLVTHRPGLALTRDSGDSPPSTPSPPLSQSYPLTSHHTLLPPFLKPFLLLFLLTSLLLFSL